MVRYNIKKPDADSRLWQWAVQLYQAGIPLHVIGRELRYHHNTWRIWFRDERIRQTRRVFVQTLPQTANAIIAVQNGCKRHEAARKYGLDRVTLWKALKRADFYLNAWRTWCEFQYEFKGYHIKICPYCTASFKTKNPRRAYCSRKCKKAAAFQRYYGQHPVREQIQNRMRDYDRKIRGK